MNAAQLLDEMDAPALYFMRQTSTLRARVDALTLALIEARDLLADPDADEQDADRVAAIIRRTLETAQ